LKELKDSIINTNNNITSAEAQVQDAVNKSLNIKERIVIVRINQTRILKELKVEVLDVIQEIQVGVRLISSWTTREVSGSLFLPGQSGRFLVLDFFLDNKGGVWFLISPWTIREVSGS
jgi:hypothetical protein